MAGTRMLTGAKSFFLHAKPRPCRGGRRLNFPKRAPVPGRGAHFGARARRFGPIWPKKDTQIDRSLAGKGSRNDSELGPDVVSIVFVTIRQVPRHRYIQCSQ